MSEVSPFRFRDYRAFWAARLASTIANTMLVVVIGIHVYDIARETMSIHEASFWLGMIGLAQFLPLFLLDPGRRLCRRPGRPALDRPHQPGAGDARRGRRSLCSSGSTRCRSFPCSRSRSCSASAAPSPMPALGSIAPNLVPPAILPSAIALEFDRLAGRHGRRAADRRRGLCALDRPALRGLGGALRACRSPACC